MVLTHPPILDATGARMASALESIAEGLERPGRITSLTDTVITDGIIEVVGTPAYVSDVTQYAAYGITQTGWYVFCRITTPTGITVTANTTVSGAAGSILTVGAEYVDIAVRFGVAAVSQRVTINWGTQAETFTFKASDLAVRNLDYRTTFYVYDVAEFVTWSFALTEDETFQEDRTYYILSDGAYTVATVTAGETVPAGLYYVHSKAHFEGMVRNVSYRLNETIDCPIEIVLPEIEDDGRGAWYDIQLFYKGAYSCTLLPPEGVIVGFVTTQAQTAGINSINLQYVNVNGTKMWSLINTHSNLPTQGGGGGN